MITLTHKIVAERTNTTIPPHLEAQAEVPVATNGWRQGDVFVRRETHPTPKAAPIALTGTGHKVVAGDADRNSHILNGDGAFYPGALVNPTLDYGLLIVPEGGVAVLTHTGEHGSVAFGEGCWRVWGQASYEAELRRAAD